MMCPAGWRRGALAPGAASNRPLMLRFLRKLSPGRVMHGLLRVGPTTGGREQRGHSTVEGAINDKEIVDNRVEYRICESSDPCNHDSTAPSFGVGWKAQ